MTIIPNKANGESLYATDLFKFIDQRDASTQIATGTGSEITIGSVVIPANSFTSGLFVIAPYTTQGQVRNAATQVNVILRAGSSPSMSGLNFIGSQSNYIREVNDATSIIGKFGGCFAHFISGLDPTIENYVAVTAQGTNGNCTSYNMVALGI